LKSRTPFVVFQFLVVKPNEHQIEDVKKLAKEIGVDDVWFKTAQVYDYEKDPNQLIPTIDKYSRYRKTGNGYEFKGKLTNHCWRLWHDPVITWDGLVAPCCFDKDAQHKLGDLKKKSFKEIWQNGEYTKFRTKILQGRKNIDICANCSEGTKVWSE
ncbi:MAG: SPASM domain-containing protein, partial [Chitinophagaceae bacterium]|nr:SPASM domain-containing protein [Chitinophagaceae bacterium]